MLHGLVEETKKSSGLDLDKLGQQPGETEAPAGSGDASGMPQLFQMSSFGQKFRRLSRQLPLLLIQRHFVNTRICLLLSEHTLSKDLLNKY